ncbi:hypothetical protein ARMGADRAFT_301347 [Armillaria gallica]|uniref:Uncharacterized protein n=1 Tax=Armillaria gallica TaxID=47427 RepID=A0A2H3CAT9_ARMGA|nr:hypothetical protein ARMGADRAFT_301347 [Armillaria gallica]
MRILQFMKCFAYRSPIEGLMYLSFLAPGRVLNYCVYTSDLLVAYSDFCFFYFYFRVPPVSLLCALVVDPFTCSNCLLSPTCFVPSGYLRCLPSSLHFFFPTPFELVAMGTSLQHTMRAEDKTFTLDMAWELLDLVDSFANGGDESSQRILRCLRGIDRCFASVDQ